MEEPKSAKIREEIVHHTIWHFTGAQILELVQEEVKKRWRQFVGCSVAGATASWLAHHWGLFEPWLVAVALISFVVVLFIWDMAAIAKRAHSEDLSSAPALQCNGSRFSPA